MQVVIFCLISQLRDDIAVIAQVALMPTLDEPHETGDDKTKRRDCAKGRQADPG